MKVLIIVALIVSLIIIIRVIQYHLDYNRIITAAEKHGWKIMDLFWSPFAPGWFGEGKERQYDVRYVDENGVEHKRICKTSAWTGVYWRD